MTFVSLATVVYCGNTAVYADSTGEPPPEKYIYTEFIPSSVFYDIEKQILADTDTLTVESKWFYENEKKKAKINVRRLFWDIDITVADSRGKYHPADRNIEIEKHPDLIINIIPIAEDLYYRYVNTREPVYNLHIPGKELLFTSIFTLESQTDSCAVREGSRLKPPVREQKLPYWSFKIRNGRIMSYEILQLPFDSMPSVSESEDQ